MTADVIGGLGIVMNGGGAPGPVGGAICIIIFFAVILAALNV